MLRKQSIFDLCREKWTRIRKTKAFQRERVVSADEAQILERRNHARARIEVSYPG